MLFHMAVGDAYGAAFEFIPFDRRSEYGLINDGVTFQRHPQLPIGNGRYTDDTQMAIAIVEVMLSVPVDMITKARLFDSYYQCFHRDQRPGYGKGFHSLLLVSKSGEDLQQRIEPGSTRSGACMRAGPVGLYHSIRDVLRIAALQASTTHDSPEGIAAAQAVALMTHYLAYDLGPRAGLRTFIQQLVPEFDWIEPHRHWVTVEALDNARAALTVVTEAKTLTEVMTQSVAVGGDVDTVAAIAMFAASLTPEIADDLTTPMLFKLEDGEYGYEYLRQIDDRLINFAENHGATILRRS
jgi:ADP-ribosylglycohydrolase